MFTYENGQMKTSVRQLVEFLLREGDIHSEGTLVADVEAMQAGSRIHRKIQKKQKATYQAEVPLKKRWEEEGYSLILEGRADGIDYTTYGNFTENEQVTLESYLNRREEKSPTISPDQKLYYIDEIKGVFHNISSYEEAKPLHLAQAKCYAAMFAQEKNIDAIGVQITYCNIETEEVRKFHYYYEREELQEWFDSLIDSYRMWASLYITFRRERQETIQSLTFPFPYREGQKKMVAMVYYSILQKKKVFFQAPTGIGKTISTIYPSLKILAEEKGEKIYYLTAKTITRTVAENTLDLLRKQGLRLKAVTITAKNRICENINDEIGENETAECNPQTCRYANGHFDRINEALYQMLKNESFYTRDILLDYARRYQVCPYELSFEAAAFCDFIICDYNYVFDPHVNRSNIQKEKESRKNILLIDEAHNLVERAREMYSAVLSEDTFDIIKKKIPEEEKYLQKKIRSCRREMRKLKSRFKELTMEQGEEESYVEMEEVDGLYFPLFHLQEVLLEYLTDHPVFEDREEVVEHFFRIRHFMGILENMTQGYRTYGMWTAGGFTIRLFCIDPSENLKEILENNMAAIFFSATLLPMPYYRNLLYGEEADAFAISSPFDAKKRLVCITNDVTSRYTRRNEQEYEKILRYLEISIEVKPGNYMIFFPSYEMMEQTYALARKRDFEKKVQMIHQEPGMEEKEKEDFLAQFQEENQKSLLAFCVLGSIFSEGIDLLGERLIGVFIVGTGLPKVCMERDMIRNYFDRGEKKGYDYAYAYPGMNKVLQAAGRVIRSAKDMGTIVLMDDRFLWEKNQCLLPEDWEQYYEVNLQNYSHVLKRFWDYTSTK